MEKNLNDIQGNLMQIHSMAHLLACEYQMLVDSEELDEAGKISVPLLSIAEIIMEKSELCLKKAEVIETKLNEHVI